MPRRECGIVSGRIRESDFCSIVRAGAAQGAAGEETQYGDGSGLARIRLLNTHWETVMDECQHGLLNGIKSRCIRDKLHEPSLAGIGLGE